MRIKNYTNKEYKCILIKIKYPPYWDDGIIFRKNLFHYQYRMYRTWKYNRKKQYKGTE